MAYKFPYDYCCIKTSSADIWFCQKCAASHDALYTNNFNDERYCPKCVPKEIEEKSIPITETQENIK